MLNTLNDAMKDRKGKEVMGEIINGLIDYAATHFATEERYFDQFAYTGAFVHKKEHQKFVNQVLEFQQGFDANELMLSMDVLDFLKTWLVKRLDRCADKQTGSDKNYSKCFNENGLN